MLQAQNKQKGKYDLDERTLFFAKNVRDFVKKLPKNIHNLEYGKQVIRSAGSVGANFIEANESLSRKDFGMRIKICRKEARETIYWLRLVETNKSDEERCGYLIQEATELMKIFGSIVSKLG